MIQNFLPGPKMIFIPGGFYKVNQVEGGFLSKKVKGFLMDETPVTVAQYREAVNAGAVSAITVHYSNYCVAGRENHPVNFVTWHQAKAYAEWAGKRLPSEAEWEWAARGGDEAREFPWGSEPPSNQLCWSGLGNELGPYNRTSTSPVGSYPKGNSKHGLKDMAGNVREWVTAVFSDTVPCCFGEGWGGFRAQRLMTRSFLFSGTTISSQMGFRCVTSVI